MTSPQETVLLGMRWLDIATLMAIVLGPLLAVVVQRLRDRWRERRDRRLGVLRGLMMTRRSQLSAEHVGALNLVELEFYGLNSVIVPYRAYVGNLSSSVPAQEEDYQAFIDQRHALFVDLLSAMAKELGYHFDKHDLGRFAYAPSVWLNDEHTHRRNAALISDLLQGKRALPITQMVPQKSDFPPPPAASS